MGWPEAKIKTPPPWKKECHYTDKSRDVMEITPPSDLEICLSIDFAPLGPRDCPLASPSGNLSGLRVHILHTPCPRAISRASGCKIPVLGKSLRPRGMYFQILGSVRIQYFKCAIINIFNIFFISQTYINFSINVLIK